jgi:uncharacterized low-complexity protein
MSSPAPAPFPSDLASLAEAAWALHPVPGYERSGLLRPECAELLDKLLVRVARGRGALDVALSEGLASISQGDRLLRLGYSCLADYARERLDVAGRTAEGLVRLGRALADRPLLHEALRSGALTIRKAQSILSVASGADEAAWVERAGRETVRALEAAVREALAAKAAEGAAQPPAGAGMEPASDDSWHRARIGLAPEARAVVDEAMELAGQLLGPASPPWQRIEAICQEYLGTYAGTVEPGAEQGDPAGYAERTYRPELERFLEDEYSRWAFLDRASAGPPSPVEAPAVADIASPQALDARLQELAHFRDRWDELLGHLAMLLRHLGLCRDMGFASFAHYCRERLQLPARSVEQRAWLARRLYDLPELRQAMREGRVGYEKARIVAGIAGEGDCAAWVAKAEQLTCIALRREVEAREAAQPCADATITLRLPARVATLLGVTLRTVRRVEGRWLSESKCLLRLAEHFVATWKAERPRSTPQRRALARDRWLCQVPGCSRAAAHAHHIQYRAHGGDDSPENLVALCAAHHLHGVHRGWVRVSGRAPDALVWDLGEREEVSAMAA